MMKNENFVSVNVAGAPDLIMRYYKTKGTPKDILVFVHGVSHGAWCWKYLMKYFTERGYACFAINLRGHGDDKKRKNRRYAPLSDYVIDLIRCIDYIENHHNDSDIQIPYSKPIVIGHSMGGGIVERYISDFPHKVKGAVLYAPATAEGMKWRGIITTSGTLRGLRTSPTALFGRKIWLAGSNFFAVKHKMRCTCRISREDLEESRQSLCKESVKAMFGLRKFSLKKNIGIPVFVVGSDKDAYFPRESLEKTADFYNTKAMILEGLCHDMMLDLKWEDSAYAVLEFLENPERLQEEPSEFIKELEHKIYSDRH